MTQAGDDLKARDALLRAFPEVEQVVGKAGRADTPTDPSPLEMVETMVNLRPRSQWPGRHLERAAASTAIAAAVASCVERGVVGPLQAEDREALVHEALTYASEAFDAAMRDFARLRQREWEPELGLALVRGVVERTTGFLRSEGRLVREPTPAELEALVTKLEPVHGPRLAEVPLAPDLVALVHEASEELVEIGAARAGPDLLVETHGVLASLGRDLAAAATGEAPDLFERMRERIAEARNDFLVTKTAALRWELEALATTAFPTAALEAAARSARDRGLLLRDPDPADHADVQSRLRSEPYLRPKTKTELLTEMDLFIRMPGWANIWTQPIINRIDMLATGVRTMIGVKVFGTDLDQIQTVSDEVADVLRRIPGAVDVFADQATGEGYIEVRIDREKAGRYGIDVGDVQEVVEVAIGGKSLTETVIGRERYPLRVRYSRDARVDEESLRRTLVAAPVGMLRGSSIPDASGAPMSVGGDTVGGMSTGGGTTRLPVTPLAATTDTFSAPLQVPLAEVADVRVVEGPSMIKSENGMLRNYVQLNVRDRDIVGFVEEARRAVESEVELPDGTHLEWSGQFEHLIHARRTLQVVLPVVILLIFVLLYLTYHDLAHAVLMMIAIPGALAGGVIFQTIFGFDFSVAVWVGYIACFGMASETGIVMLVYLREALRRHGGVGNVASTEALREIVVDGAVRRLRPKLLTEGAMILGLAPMLWASGTGAEVIRPMAAPVLGGILMADEVIDVFLPVLFYWWEKKRWRRAHGPLTRSGSRLP